MKEKREPISTLTFMILFISGVFLVALGIPLFLTLTNRTVTYPTKVNITENCCDTGYCVKTLDKKVFQKISTQEGLLFLKDTNIKFFLVKEYDVFGNKLNENIIWKK